MTEVQRREIKYIIPVLDFYQFRKNIAGYLKLDSYAGENGYYVRSLYFDSQHDKDLRDVLDGVLEKKKIRLRIYSVEDKMVKLEYKCKFGFHVRKQTMNISREDALRMSKGDYEFLLNHNEPLAIELYTRLKFGGYIPKVIVEYNRIPYYYMTNNIRITFDSEVRGSCFTSNFFEKNLSFEPCTSSNMGVLEVKYDGFLFSHLKSALESIDALATSNSKYVQARLLYI